MWRTAFIAVTLLLGTFRTGHAQDTDALKLRLQAHMDSMHATGRFPGATAAVTLRDGRTIAVAVGHADTIRDIAMQPEARMLAGSVGKMFVAAVAVQLMAEDRLDLDAPVSRYLGSEPWFRRLPNAERITVRHIMTHTSGLVRYEFDERVTETVTREPDKVWSPVERLSYLFDTQAAFAPGEGWDYSDTNYIVLGMIIEHVTGNDLYAEIDRRVLEPLQLRNTIPSDRRRLPGVVQGYAGPQNPFGRRDAMIEDGLFIMNPQLEWAGGGFASTAGDLSRWASLFHTGRAFPERMLPTVLNGVPARLGQSTQYGLGTIIRPTPHGPGYGHGGFFPGYLTEVRYYPELGISVALQFNTSVSRSIGRNPSAALDVIAGIVAAAEMELPPVFLSLLLTDKAAQTQPSYRRTRAGRLVVTDLSIP